MGIREKYRDKYRVKIGFVPTRRETFSETAFRLDKSRGDKEKSGRTPDSHAGGLCKH